MEEKKQKFSGWYQKEFSFQKRSRGFYLVTSEVLENIKIINEIEIGVLHLFLKHTSAGLTINENFDSDVLKDMETSFNRLVPEDPQLYLHTSQGKDDMPAHVQTVLLGNSLTIPITNGKLNMGTWQGIYLAEHRDAANVRSVVATIQGKPFCK